MRLEIEANITVHPEDPPEYWRMEYGMGGTQATVIDGQTGIHDVVPFSIPEGETIGSARERMENALRRYRFGFALV